MKTEFEAKFYPVDKSQIRERLEAIGARLSVPERLMRRAVFDELKNPDMKVTYLRVRDEGNLVRLSAKIHAKEEGKLTDQKETDVVVSSFGETVKILEAGGLIKSSYQENKRETWVLDGAEIVIDTWPALEPYIEIEAKSETQVKQVAEKLGFKWKDRIITSVVEIYARKYEVSKDEALQGIIDCTFEKKPF